MTIEQVLIALAVYVLVTLLQGFAIYGMYFAHLQQLCPAIAKHCIREDRQAAIKLACDVAWVPLFSVIAVLAITGFKFKIRSN